MIICRFSYSNNEETFESLEEAIAALENEEIACCDDEELAENIYEVKCDLLEALELGDYAMIAEEDDDGNFIFER